MHLSRLELRDFRAYRTAALELPDVGQVLVYGANNAGKSSLVSGLDLVAGQVPPRMAWRDSPDVAVTATFDLSDDEAARAVAEMPQAPDSGFIPGGGFRRVSFEFRGPETAAIPIIHRIEGQVRPGAMVTLYELVPISPTMPLMYHVMGMPTNTVLSSGFTGGPQGRQQHQQTPDPGQMLQELQPLMRLLGEWRARLFHFSSSRRVPSRDIQLQPEAELLPNGENLGKVLTWMSHNEPELWQSLSDLMQQLVPDLGLLQLPTEGVAAQVGFREAETRSFLNLESLGSGVAQLLLTVTLGVMQSDSSVLILEEPETGLHPAAQHALADMLQQWSQDRLIVMTTHSTAFLPLASTNDDVHALLVERSNGESSVRRIDSESLSEIGEALGVRLLDVLVAERILVVEGTTDVAVLQTWFPNIKRDPRIALVVAEGGNGARGAAEFSKWLGQADGVQRRKVLFLRDQDELPASELDRLTALGVVHVLKVREIENYLLSAPALSSYLATAGVEVGIDELDSAMRDAASALVSSVVLRTAARAQETIRLCDDVARGQLVKTGAGLREFTDHVLMQIPGKRETRTRLRAEWRKIESDLSGRWDEEWRQIAPGEEVLRALFLRYLSRGFSKKVDGPALASHLPAVPEELVNLLGDFLETVPSS